MSYLILNDYYSQIQIQNLMSLVNNDITKLTSAANKAEEQCKEHLKQKYDLSKEFTNTSVWSFTKSYPAGSRVYLDAVQYSASSSYVANQLTLQSGNVYICTGATTGAFDVTKWTLLGAQYELFYAHYPKPEFNINSLYQIDDEVFWKDKVYTALTSSNTDIDGIQYGKYSNLPAINAFPGDEGAQWDAGVSYSVAAGTLPINTEFFTQGDNRGQRILEVLIDITLYKIHARIAPRNIPDFRVLNYQDAIQWLKDAANGEVTPNLPLLQPNQGNRIRYGGNIKLDNNW